MLAKVSQCPSERPQQMHSSTLQNKDGRKSNTVLNHILVYTSVEGFREGLDTDGPENITCEAVK